MAAMTSAQQKQMPKDATVITLILKELGITEYEPRVINQLLEFTYRYVASVLEDAKVYANHSKKKSLDLDDVRLAISMQLDRSFTTPPPRDVLLEIARMRNNNPLPLVKPHCGIRLPPDRYCLNSCNYRLKSTIPKKFNHASVASGSYTMQQQGGVKMGIKAPQLHMIKRPSNASMTTVPRTQSISTPKPVIKFSPAGMHQTQMKPKIQIATASSQGIEMAMKFETDEENSLKRKREPDNYDSLDH